MVGWLVGWRLVSPGGLRQTALGRLAGGVGCLACPEEGISKVLLFKIHVLYLQNSPLVRASIERSGCKGEVKEQRAEKVKDRMVEMTAMNQIY